MHSDGDNKNDDVDERLIVDDIDFETAMSILDARYRIYEASKQFYDLAIEERNLWLRDSTSPQRKLYAEESFLVGAFPYYAYKYRAAWFPTAQVDRLMRKVRPEWDYFSALDFEHLVRAMLFLIQGNVYKLTKASGDGGLDLIHDEQGEMPGGGYFNVRTVAQCKLYRGSLPVGAVRDFFGAMAANVAEGYLFTTGTLTKSGIKFVEEANRSPHANRLHIICKSQIDELLELSTKIREEEAKNDLDDIDFDLVEKLAERGRALLAPLNTSVNQPKNHRK